MLAHSLPHVRPSDSQLNNLQQSAGIRKAKGQPAFIRKPTTFKTELDIRHVFCLLWSIQDEMFVPHIN